MILDAVGRHDEATQAMARGRQIGVQLGTGWEQPLFDFAQAVAQFREGEWDDSLAKSVGGIETADVLGLGMGILWPYAIASVISSCRGDTKAADRWITLGQERSAEQPAMLGLDWLVWAQAVAALESGDLRGAHELLVLVWDIAAAMGVEGSWMVVVTDLARTSCRLGDRQRAEQVRDGIQALADRARCVVNDATALWVRGVVDGDVTALDAAAAHFGEVNRPWDLALLAATGRCCWPSGTPPGRGQTVAPRWWRSSSSGRRAPRRGSGRSSGLRASRCAARSLRRARPSGGMRSHRPNGPCCAAWPRAAPTRASPSSSSSHAGRSSPTS